MTDILNTGYTSNTSKLEMPSKLDWQDLNNYPILLLKIFLSVITILLIANLVSIGIQLNFQIYHDNYYVNSVVKLFDFNEERNIPTLYSSFALIIASILLFTITSIHRKNGSPYYYWLGLGFIFLFLSVDEIASIHERLILPLRELLQTSGFLYFAWVIPYGIAFLIFSIAYSKFLFSLPNKTKLLFIVSGATFIAGAIGFELIGGKRVELYGEDNFIYCLIYTCEEFLEMLGIVIFNYALITYITEHIKGLKIAIKI